MSEFRSRLIQGNAELALLEKMLGCFREHGLLKMRGQQHTDSTHVFGSVRALNRLEGGLACRGSLNWQFKRDFANGILLSRNPVIRELRERASIFAFKEGTIYPALYRLAAQGLVETRLGEAGPGGAPVRFYQLSPKGREALVDRWALWDQFGRDVEAVRIREST